MLFTDPFFPITIDLVDETATSLHRVKAPDSSQICGSLTSSLRKISQHRAAVTVADMFKLVAWFVIVLQSSKPYPTGTTHSDAELTTAATLAQL